MQSKQAKSTWFENLQNEIKKIEDDRAKRPYSPYCSCGNMNTLDVPDYEKRIIRTHAPDCLRNAK